NRYDVAIKMADLFARTRDEGFASPARSRFRDFLSEAGRSQGPLERSLASRALRVLSGHQEGEPDLGTMVSRALLAFEEHGARRAYDLAVESMSEAQQIASFIEAHDPVDEDALGAAVASLVELDSGALELASLSNLLLLGKNPGDSTSVAEQFERLQNRTANRILDGVERAGHIVWSHEAAQTH